MSDLRLQVLLSTIDKATKPLRDIMAGSAGTARALKETRDKLKALNSAQKDLDGFRQLKQQTQTTATKLQQAKQRVAELAGQMRGTQPPTKALAKDFEKAKAAASRLKQQHADQTQKLQGLRNKMREAGVDTNKLAEHQTRLRAATDAANKAMERQKARLETLGKARERMQRTHAAGMKIAAHGLGAMYLGQRGARAAASPLAEFAGQENAATQMRASMMRDDGTAPEEFEGMKQLAESLGNRLPGTTSDFYAMMTQLKRQGLDGQVILGGLGEAAAFLGVQLQMDYKEAGTFAAKMKEATRTAEKDMMGLMDVIQRGFFQGVDQNEMLAAYSMLTPALRTLKMEGLEAARALAPLVVQATKMGMDGGSAGNAFAKIFDRAINPSRIGKANKLLKEFGISLDFTDGDGGFGGLEQMYSELERIKGLDDVTRGEVLRKLFGDDAETRKALSVMIDNGIEGYRQVQQAMDSQASLQQRVNVQLGTLSNLWEAASGTFTNVLAAVGEAIAPEIKGLVEWLNEVASSLQGWIKAHPRLVGWAAKLGLVLAGLLTVVGGIALAIGTLLMPFAGLQFALTTAGPMLAKAGGWLAWMLKPVRLLGHAMLWLGRVFLLNPIGLVITALIGVVWLLWKHWDTVVGFVADSMEWTAGKLRAIWDGVLAYLRGAWDVIADLFTGDWERVRSGVSAQLEVIGAVFGEWPAKLMQFGFDMIDGLIGGITAKATALKEAVTGVASGAIDWFRDKLDINSPSRVFAAFGRDTIDGYTLGLESHQDEPLRAAGDLASRMRQIGAGVALGAAAMPSAAFDTRAPIAAQAAGSAGSGGIHIEAIHIHAAPGMDAHAIARAVRDEIARLERERGARNRSRLGDYDD